MSQIIIPVIILISLIFVVTLLSILFHQRRPIEYLEELELIANSLAAINDSLNEINTTLSQNSNQTTIQSGDITNNITNTDTTDTTDIDLKESDYNYNYLIE